MKRGTVVLAKFPFTDLTASKRRPAVVASPENRTNEDVIVAFITSIIPDHISETDLVIGPGHDDFKESGLTRTSLVRTDKLATLNRSVLTGELGNLSSGTMKQIDEGLKKALGLK